LTPELPISTITGVRRELDRSIIRKARIAKGWTQTQLAARLRWSMLRVSRIERGAQRPLADDLEALRDALGFPTLDEFYRLPRRPQLRLVEGKRRAGTSS
jgi:transcriptional regulator with XRE-family HTH domain